MFNYKEYFKKIKPKTTMDIYNRYLFAFLSVHTTWERNIIAYELLRNKYHTNPNKLKKLLSKSGVGLYNNRTHFIHKFTVDFLENPKAFTKKRLETWKGYANRIQNRVLGLGFAKTRFAIELIYPSIAKVVCVDTHIIQWAKQNPNKMNKTLYNKIETGWMNHSKQIKVNPVEARWKWWDNKQGFTDSRYWSHVLED